MPTLRLTLDRTAAFVEARLYVPKAAGAEGVAGSRLTRFWLTPCGSARLRELGIIDEGDFVPGELLDEMVIRREATHSLSPTGGRLRLFPEPKPPGWMVPKLRKPFGLI